MKLGHFCLLGFLDKLALLDYLESFSRETTRAERPLFQGHGAMKSGSSGGQRDGDEDADDAFETRPEPLHPPLKGEGAAREFDDFDEEDFDDEFDDDFEEELEDEYDLSEFGEPTEEDLEADEVADVTAMGDFVDEDAEPEEPPVEEANPEAAAEPDPKGKKKKKSKGKSKDDDLDDED